MQRFFAVIGLCAVACLLGVGGGVWLMRSRVDPVPPPPDPPAVVEKIREVARLETLHLTLHKKISFEPDPVAADSLWGDVANFVKFTVRNPKGKAIVFAQVELGLDLRRLDPTRLHIEGRRIEVALPPLEAQVQLLPGETEVIGSNLNSEETAGLFEKAKAAFEREVMADPKLQAQARESSERAIRALLITLGFREVVFVSAPRPVAKTG
ncbi:MAG: DUF4230 domain-containing protein [Myxococcaceae bacterium]|nr:DUF4230 domain-containing protein [Myxococcaceae bacterium]